jgi:hypothetical protein
MAPHRAGEKPDAEKATFIRRTPRAFALSPPLLLAGGNQTSPAPFDDKGRDEHGDVQRAAVEDIPSPALVPKEHACNDRHDLKEGTRAEA